MAARITRSGSTVGTTLATLSVPKPTGVADGELMLLLLQAQINPGTITTDFAPPPGWTRVGLASNAASPAFAGRVIEYYYKPVPSAAAETATSYTVTNAAPSGNRMMATIHCIAGHDPALIFAVGTWGTQTTVPAVSWAGLALVTSNAQFTTPNNGSLVSFMDGSWTKIRFQSQSAPAPSQTIVIDGGTDTGQSRSVAGLWTKNLPANTSAQPNVGPTLASTGLDPGVNSLVIKDTPAAAAPTPGVTYWTGTAEITGPLSTRTAFGEVKFTTAPTFAKGGPHTYASVIGQAQRGLQMFCAHRGGSVNWPEMTTYAYRAAVYAYAMNTLEISVFVSSDGQFICSHDPDTARVTGQAYTIASTPAATLTGLSATISCTDPPTPQPHLCLLTDVLNEFAATHLILIEDKSYANGAALRALISTYPNFRQHFVWKSYGAGGTSDVTAAHALGLASWGYFFDADMPSFEAKQGLFTLAGLDFNSSDATLTSALALAGKTRCLGHIITSTAQRDRLFGLGFIGLVVSNVRAVIPRR